MLAAGSVNHVTACTTKYAAGIAIMSGKTLTISGSGSLTATGKGRDDGFGGAGIGGSLNDNAGNVVITGGTITATGGYGAAGIGGGNGGSYDSHVTCGTITITRVTATKGRGSGSFNSIGRGRNTGGTVGTTAKARYTMATIRTDVSSGVNGIILFPDGVDIANTTDYFTTLGKINESSSYATKCTSAQWTALAAKGCAFLPAAGYREGLTVYNAGASGYYWSSSAHTSEVNQAYYVYFNSGALNSQYNGSRKKGQSVRLVCAAE